MLQEVGQEFPTFLAAIRNYLKLYIELEYKILV